MTIERRTLFMKLVLVRNCETAWSEEEKFMGWTDIPLSSKGIEHAHTIGKKLKSLNIPFGIAYTSVLKRTEETLKYIKEELKVDIKTRSSYKLNAKHYGSLEGLSKSEVEQKTSKEQIMKWRRGYDIKPPELQITDQRFPGNDPKYADILKFELPLSESLKDVDERATDYFEREISTFLKVDENVLIVAHGSVIRSIVKRIEEISADEMCSLQIENGQIIVYDLDDNLKPINKKIVD